MTLSICSNSTFHKYRSHHKDRTWAQRANWASPTGVVCRKNQIESWIDIKSSRVRVPGSPRDSRSRILASQRIEAEITIPSAVESGVAIWSAWAKTAGCSPGTFFAIKLRLKDHNSSQNSINSRWDGKRDWISPAVILRCSAGKESQGNKD